MTVPLLCYCVFDLFLDCLPLEFQFSKIRNFTNVQVLPCIHVNDIFLCSAGDFLEEISNFIDIYAFSIPNLEVTNLS